MFGSGALPDDTSMEAPAFPPGFADYAKVRTNPAEFVRLGMFIIISEYSLLHSPHHCMPCLMAVKVADMGLSMTL